jgi:LIVCS family branched-chain amino acid:cation transporter
MSDTQKSHTITTGLAMFSMFFGAGNVVFPLALGQYAQDHNLYAILGLLITAVGVPFAGLIAMTLFNGDYKKFFDRIGPIPGFIVAAVIMGLIGSFGAIPRCIALSYSTAKLYFPSLSLQWFSIISCLIIFAFTIKKNSILDVLGYVLTPILLLSLSVIIIKGILNSPAAPQADHSKLMIFWDGIKEGYQTMDLLGAFFFSSVVLACLRKEVDPSDQKNYRAVIFTTLKASCIGAFLLSIIYVGFSFVAAFQSESLVGIAKDELAGRVAINVLGPYAGIIACLAVALACLTTAIALAAVFAEFIHKDVTRNRVSYGASLVITLVISYFVSTLNFTGIANFLFPILQICYPALIVLTIVNILYKLHHFKPVKVPVLITFVLSLIGYFWR